MQKTKFPAVVATFILCFAFWLLLTWSFAVQELIAGAVVSLAVALFAARFFIHEKAFWLLRPDRLLLLIFYCLGITAYCVRQALLQGFYSIQVTSIPVAINITVMILNIVLSYLLVKLMGANGLGLAYSLAGFASITMLTFMLRTKVGSLRGKEIATSVVKCLIACVIMYIVIYLIRALLEGALNFPIDRKIGMVTELMILVIIGMLTYVIAAFALKMRELKSVLAVVMRKLGK